MFFIHSHKKKKKKLINKKKLFFFPKTYLVTIHLHCMSQRMFGCKNFITQFSSLNFHHSSLNVSHPFRTITHFPSLNIFHTICVPHTCHSVQLFFSPVPRNSNLVKEEREKKKSSDNPQGKKKKKKKETQEEKTIPRRRKEKKKFKRWSKCAAEL